MEKIKQVTKFICNHRDKTLVNILKGSLLLPIAWKLCPNEVILTIPEVQVAKYTVFEVRDDLVLFSLLSLGQCSPHLAKIADQRGLVIIGGVCPEVGLVLYNWAEGY